MSRRDIILVENVMTPNNRASREGRGLFRGLRFYQYFVPHGTMIS